MDEQKQPNNNNNENNESGLHKKALKTGMKFLNWNAEQVKNAYDLSRITGSKKTKQEFQDLKERLNSIKQGNSEFFTSFDDMVAQRGYTTHQLKQMYKKSVITSWICLGFSFFAFLYAMWYMGGLINNGFSLLHLFTFLAQMMFVFYAAFAGLFYYAYPALQIRARDLFSARDFFKLGLSMIPSSKELPPEWEK